MTNNKVSVQTQFADGLPFIQGDRVQLRQVMLNLIINAIEAMTEMGEGSRRLPIGTRKEGSDGAPRHRAGFRAWAPSRQLRQPVRCILHHKARRHGNGAVDLPVDR